MKTPEQVAEETMIPYVDAEVVGVTDLLRKLLASQQTIRSLSSVGTVLKVDDDPTS